MARFTIDVEGDGQCPGLYSMVSFGVVDIDNTDNTFYGKTSPLGGAKWEPEALAISGFTRKEHFDFPDPFLTMNKFNQWLSDTYGKQRHIMWSDNPAYDWQFINYYFHRFIGSNPFGYSARRIGDLYAGFVKDPRKSSAWKKLRDTKHNHNPVDDAMGNAEVLNKIFRRMKNG